MNQEEQKTAITVEQQYNSTSNEIIKDNIIKLLNESGYKNNYIADKIGVSVHTIYSWRKSIKNGGNIPEFITAVKLCNYLNVSIDILVKE